MLAVAGRVLHCTPRVVAAAHWREDIMVVWRGLLCMNGAAAETLGHMFTISGLKR